MQNAKNYLVMMEFEKTDNSEAVLEKLVCMFDVCESFVNLFENEGYMIAEANGQVYKSQLEKVFLTLKDKMPLKNLVREIGYALMDFNYYLILKK